MSNPEFHAVLDLLSLLLFDWRTGILLVLLLTAAVIDYRTHRIPNRLVIVGIVFGLLYNMAFPLYSDESRLSPFLGMMFGFLAFLPLYGIGAMGAGDVKLMAMVGSIVGPRDMLPILLCTMITGGVLSLLLVLYRGTAGRMFHNLRGIFKLTVLNTLTGGRPNVHFDASTSAAKLPYGVAIAIGTIGYLTSHQLGFI